jgi:hypothetical protein
MNEFENMDIGNIYIENKNIEIINIDNINIEENINIEKELSDIDYIIKFLNNNNYLEGSLEERRLKHKLIKKINKLRVSLILNNPLNTIDILKVLLNKDYLTQLNQDMLIRDILDKINDIDQKIEFIIELCNNKFKNIRFSFCLIEILNFNLKKCIKRKTFKEKNNIIEKIIEKVPSNFTIDYFFKLNKLYKNNKLNINEFIVKINNILPYPLKDNVKAKFLIHNILFEKIKENTRLTFINEEYLISIFEKSIEDQDSVLLNIKEKRKLSSFIYKALNYQEEKFKKNYKEIYKLLLEKINYIKERKEIKKYVKVVYIDEDDRHYELEETMLIDNNQKVEKNEINLLNKQDKIDIINLLKIETLENKDKRDEFELNKELFEIICPIISSSTYCLRQFFIKYFNENTFSVLFAGDQQKRSDYIDFYCKELFKIIDKLEIAGYKEENILKFCYSPLYLVGGEQNIKDVYVRLKQMSFLEKEDVLFPEDSEIITSYIPELMHLKIIKDLGLDTESINIEYSYSDFEEKINFLLDNIVIPMYLHNTNTIIKEILKSKNTNNIDEEILENENIIKLNKDIFKNIYNWYALLKRASHLECSNKKELFILSTSICPANPFMLSDLVGGSYTCMLSWKALFESFFDIENISLYGLKHSRWGLLYEKQDNETITIHRENLKFLHSLLVNNINPLDINYYKDLLNKMSKNHEIAKQIFLGDNEENYDFFGDKYEKEELKIIKEIEKAKECTDKYQDMLKGLKEKLKYNNELLNTKSIVNKQEIKNYNINLKVYIQSLKEEMNNSINKNNNKIKNLSANFENRFKKTASHQTFEVNKIRYSDMFKTIKKALNKEVLNKI